MPVYLRLFLPILLLLFHFDHAFCEELSQNFEDITVRDSLDESRTTPQPRARAHAPFKHSNADKATKAMLAFLSLKNTNAKLGSYKIFKEGDGLESRPAYGARSNGRGGRKKTKRPREDEDSELPESDEVVGRDDSRLVVAGIPDMSDPCFRRYANCIIVNAQPYERRSSTALINCKAHCLQSQSGTYNCRSFIYDTINQVCDLFAHVGDQSPARLLKFQTRDYFEPTNTVQCLSLITSAASPLASSLSTSFPLPTPPPLDPIQIPQQSATSDFASEPNDSEELAPVRSEHFTPQQTFQEEITELPTQELLTDRPVAHASHIDERSEAEKAVDIPVKIKEITPTRPSSSPTLPTTSQDPSTSIALQGTLCPVGKITKYLRTESFELFNHDENPMPATDPAVCLEACEKNFVLGRALDCKSFDYFGGMCYFTDNAAVPVGTGQLRPKSDSFYYEEVCVDRELAQNCPPTFSRYPQMIIVGFAESVSDSPSFEHCFDSCLNSYELFGFNCSSGMYYFEESQLNCILNTEDRLTQSELFTEENTDIVDYFEVSCKPKSTRRYSARKTLRGVKTYERSVGTHNLVLASTTSTEWSECVDGKQHRRKDCSDGEIDCGMESRSCYLNVSPSVTSQQSHWFTLSPTQSDEALTQANNEAEITISSVGTEETVTQAGPSKPFPQLITGDGEEGLDRIEGEPQPPGFIPNDEMVASLSERQASDRTISTSGVWEDMTTEMPFSFTPTTTRATTFSTTVSWETSTRPRSRDRLPTRHEIAEMKAQIRKNGFNCPLNFCCKVFTTCAVGLRHNTKTRRLEYCRTPCQDLQKHRRLLSF